MQQEILQAWQQASDIIGDVDSVCAVGDAGHRASQLAAPVAHPSCESSGAYIWDITNHCGLLRDVDS
jgi:hypothetical protein